MKTYKIRNIISLIVLGFFLILAIGSDEEAASSINPEPTIDSSNNSSSSSSSSLKESNPDVCRCLTEPGNTEWAKDNRYTCRDAISEEIGVANWETVNFSQNPTLDAQWNRLVASCGY